MSIGTHSGSFQADEAMGVWLLRRLARFGGPEAPVVRSRNPDVLKPLEIVIDVGGTYDHSALRYDHHQRGFAETFSDKFSTKLSASGLVYKHWGREVLSALHPRLRASPDELEWVFEKLYRDLMEGLDAIDNGIEIADAPRYTEGSGLATRVARLNPRWNEANGPSEDARFEKASALCGEEFASALEYIVEAQLPARTLVEAALLARKELCPSGALLRLEQASAYHKATLRDAKRC
jgi:uncharacterized UPF0160 family protein